MALALCLAAAGLVLTAMSFAHGIAALAANPTCVTPTGQLAEMLAKLRLDWLLGGATASLSLVVCSLIARHGAQMASAARTTQVFNAITLVALALSFCGYGISSFGACIG